jgi:murein L,D-transpeptidase YafK
MNKRIKTRLFIYGILILGFVLFQYGRSIWHPIYTKIVGKNSLDDIYQKYGIEAKQRLQKSFTGNDIQSLPSKITIIGLKRERNLEIWDNSTEAPKLIKTYPFTGYSGKLGPKLKAGDRQIPEGLYKINFLNPNSSYHLSLQINYPNDFDKQKAKEGGRKNLGDLIFIHGKSVTIGCIPIGDKEIEEVFTLVYLIGKENVDVILSPIDFRVDENYKSNENSPSWITEKYDRIKNKIIQYNK